jgi:tetratricopeptide (TPR) repeat protein
MREGAVLALAIILAPASGASAQGHALHTLPVVDAALLERPIAMQSGIGRAHDTSGASSPEAQRFFDQGLTYLHHFEWIQAARSFNQALRLDADLVLGWIGLSIAHVELNQSAQASRAFERARALAGRYTDHDRVHVAIRERQIAAAAAPGDRTRLAEYRKAIDDALARFPSDVELWLQRGVAESPDIADRGQGSTPGAVRFYVRALEIEPNHFAAHHYLTHAYENSGRLKEALEHGAVYAKSAPGVPHARHMYGHDLRRLGRTAEAIAEFEAADRLEVEAFTREAFRPEYDWHYEHNLDLLGTSYQHEGQMVRAERALKAAFALPTANLSQAINKRQWLVFLRARGRADEALAEARALLDFPYPVVQAVGQMEIAYALILKRQFKDAAAAANAALAALKAAPAGAGLAAPYFEALQGEFFLQTGQREKGRSMLEAAVKKARSAQGPDDWAQALFTLESAAAAARRAGDWPFAGFMARQMVEHDPSYAGGHYALALAAEHDGDRRTAAAEFALVEKYWGHADPNLPELVESRAKARQ